MNILDCKWIADDRSETVIINKLCVPGIIDTDDQSFVAKMRKTIHRLEHQAGVNKINVRELSDVVNNCLGIIRRDPVDK